MKKQSRKTAKMMQQGGLMIEALAMLGLISVVTPTMYKKAAERTMEVEDINTASTVRTYANAAESYVANNYGKLMDTQFTNVSTVTDPDTGETKTVKTPKADGTTVNLRADDADFKKYLPYGFEPSRSLYDYNTPKIRIVKNGTNLTSFVLFPAKSGADIGQERTARIASLIGSSGGYMTNDTTARGVGGIWQLSVGENGVFKAADFGDNDSKQYSLVTMSSNAMTDNNGGMIDNDKYLQRTYEGSGQEWRNTMHADLYMGNHMSGETQSIAANLRQRNSIRDVKSLIINAEHADENYGNEDDEAYGLFVSGDAGDNYTGAYIGGYLSAFENHFFVKGDEEGNPRLYFGRNNAGPGVDDYNFLVESNGDIYDKGYSGELFNRFKSFDSSDENSFNIGGGAVQATYTKGTDTHHKLSMHLGDDDTFKITTNAGEERDDMAISMLGPTMKIYNDSTADKKQRISMFKVVDNKGYMTDNATGEPGMTVNGQAGRDSLGNEIGPKYNSTTTPPDFRVDVGANVKVQGVLAAGQVDTQHLRTASFSSGSEHIDDDAAEKWMKVDQYGIKFGSSNEESLTTEAPLFMMHSINSDDNSENAITGTYTGIRMASDGEDYTPEINSSGGDAVLNLVRGSDHSDGSYVELRADDTHINIDGENSEITFHGGATAEQREDETSARAYPNGYRVRQLGGDFDLDAANLNVTDKNNKRVFSVRGNEATDSVSKFNNPYTRGSLADYNVAVHGNTIFTGTQETSLNNSGEETQGEIKYMSIGKYDKEAGVNIIATGKTKDNYVKNVLVIDQTENVNSRNLPRTGSVSNNKFYLYNYRDADISSVTGSITGLLNTSDNIDPGAIYIRKGMIEIVPEENSEVNKEYYAHQGSGVVRASRFVANNWDSNGRSYGFDPILTETEYETYNGTNRERYDTYMVNPAYTSVMKDIKLTTRGGARLSDILPDFINKGIYVANNTYGERTRLTFSGWGSSREMGGNYASPFLGEIPAPQCPPGYGKVITVHPMSFNMAQAGRLTKARDHRYAADQGANIPLKIVDDEQVEEAVSSLEYAKLKVNYNNDNNGGTITLKENGTNNMVSHEVTGVSSDLFTVDKENSTSTTYVLTTNNPNAAEPITFQQSTYLKTVVVPLCEGAAASGYPRTNCSKSNYTSGWAALMGFIYPYDIYESVISELEDNALVKPKEFVTDTTTNTTWYWNIFPVLRNSLEAFATVYCYFDRTDIEGSRYEYRDNIDTYDYLNHNPKQFVPTNTTYRQRLNDPTLKYNELW